MLTNVVVGMGVVGKAIADMIASAGPVVGVDVAPANISSSVHTLHLCYPYDERFVSEAMRYIKRFNPELSLIHSTVVPGTTEEIAGQVSCLLAYSPVRGRHNSMRKDLERYTKFVAGANEEAHTKAQEFLQLAGFKVGSFDSPRALELGKLIETTYSGLLIAWAQEMDRLSEMVGVDYLDVMRFLAEIDYLPPVIFQPGYIGGHCIINNLELLEIIKVSSFASCIRESNARIPSSGEQLYPMKHGAVA